MKNYLTYKQLDAVALRISGLSQSVIDPPTRQLLINLKLTRLHGYLDGLADPFFHASESFGVQGRISYPAVFSIDATLKQITLSAGTLAAGAVCHILYFQDGGTVNYQFSVRITVGGSPATYEVLYGTDATLLLVYSVWMAAVSPQLTATIPLNDKYVNKIIRVYDNQGTGGTERTFVPFTDSNAFGRLESNPLFNKQVAYYHSGDNLHLRVGASATALGTVTIEYRQGPTVYTAATESSTVSLPPQYNEQLVDEVVGSYLLYGGKDLPSNLKERLQGYEKAFKAEASDQAEDEKTRLKRV